MNDNIDGHKAIVICVDHYNPLGLIRSLGEKGINPIVILLGEKTLLIQHSIYPSIIHRVDDRDEALKLLEDKYGNESLKPIVFTCDDRTVETIDELYNNLHQKFILYNAGEQGRIVHFMNKHNINIAAKEVGFRIPRAEVLKKGEFPKTVPYPVITKAIVSTQGAWKKDVFICRDEAELKVAYSKIKSDTLLVEEFFEKKNELCVDGVSMDGGKTVFMPLKCHYIRFSDKAYGNYMTMYPFEDAELKEQIRKLFEYIGFEGIFSIEFLVTKDDDLIFLEINFRNSTWSYSSTYAGANLPYIWARSAISNPVDLSTIKIPNTPFKAMAEANDFKENVRHGNIGLFRWIREFHECECPYIYNKSDIKPFKALFNEMFWSRVKKRLHL